MHRSSIRHSVLKHSTITHSVCVTTSSAQCACCHCITGMHHSSIRHSVLKHSTITHSHIVCCVMTSSDTVCLLPLHHRYASQHSSTHCAHHKIIQTQPHIYTVYEGIFGMESTKYTVIYGVYIWFWPALSITPPKTVRKKELPVLIKIMVLH